MRKETLQKIIDSLNILVIPVAAVVGVWGFDISVYVAGGVAANRGLRESLSAAAEQNNLKLTFPKMVYCTDNAAMIAVAGYFKNKYQA